MKFIVNLLVEAAIFVICYFVIEAGFPKESYFNHIIGGAVIYLCIANLLNQPTD